MSFLIPLFGKGENKLQPVYIDDVAKAIERIASLKLKGSHVFELVGPNIFSYRSLYLYLCECLGIKRIFVPIPHGVARICISILNITPFKLLTIEQLNLFQSDNLPLNIDKNFKYLDIEAQDIKEIIKISINK